MRRDEIQETIRISHENDRQAALKQQRELSRFIEMNDRFPPIRLIGGIDLAYHAGQAIAAIATFEANSMEPVEEKHAILQAEFPYISGLLTYREFPALYQAYSRLERKPELLLFDGQGLAHPRRMGIATHAGILLDIPSIGVAKSRLTGDFQSPGPNRFDATAMTLDGQHIGYVLRSKENCKPIYISSGHRVSPDSALAIVKSALRETKLPVPTHYADRFSKKLKLSS